MENQQHQNFQLKMDCLLLKMTLAMRLHQGNLLKGIDNKPLEKNGNFMATQGTKWFEIAVK